MYSFKPVRQRSLTSRREAHNLGVEGENIAVHYLEGKGYTILERNYRSGKHEVDIIALDGEDLVMVEVKTRSDTRFGAPEEAVNHKKRWFIMRVANQYVRSHGRKENVRMDIISIVLRDGQPELTHIEGAFNIFNF